MFLLVLISSNVMLCQNIYINDNYEGVIFPKTYKNKKYQFLDDEFRFTPSLSEIEDFERDLKKKIKGINKNRWNQKHSCPVIHKNLKKYVRQYLGFIDDSGKKYLVVNFLWKKSSIITLNVEDDYFYDEKSDWKKHWHVWFDGCSHFWNVKYYLESDVLFDLQVNGSS